MTRVPTEKEREVQKWLLRFGVEGQLRSEPPGFVLLLGGLADTDRYARVAVSARGVFYIATTALQINLGQALTYMGQLQECRTLLDTIDEIAPEWVDSPTS